MSSAKWLPPSFRPLNVLFVLSLFALPAAQAAWEWGRGEEVRILGVLAAQRSDRIESFEEDLRLASWVRHSTIPVYQAAVSRLFGHGSRRVVRGRQGRLFYADDVEVETDRGFGGDLTDDEALDVIANFRDQLAERGIALLVVPVPSKAVLDARFLQIPASAGPLPASVARRLEDALRDRGIPLLELERSLKDAEAGLVGDAGLFLPRDAHWRPEVMAWVAEQVAERAKALVELPPVPGLRPLTTVLREQRAIGDLVDLLQLRDPASVFPPMEFVIRRVESSPGVGWQPDPSADVLVLGDSFTKIFSDEGLGMGTHAGFAEQIALHLGRPLDVLAILGGSSNPVREALSRRVGGLDGKRLVIWQFAARGVVAREEVWRRIPLPPPGSEVPIEPRVPSATGLTLVGRITEVTKVPEHFDYEECLAVQEFQVEEVLAGEWDVAEPLWVAFLAIDHFERLEPDRFQVGERIRMTLENVNDHYNLEEFSWGDQTDAGFDIYWPTEWKRME